MMTPREITRLRAINQTIDAVIIKLFKICRILGRIWGQDVEV